jgi:hypothetical protein
MSVETCQILQIYSDDQIHKLLKIDSSFTTDYN